MLGSSHEQRSNAVGNSTSYLPDADPGRQGGNTYTGASSEPTIQDYENFFGPSARDIKTDLQRFKRHGRWHLPDILKGPNPWLTDRVDGLITDATNSPFTTKILPYRYKDEVDGKIKWNVWQFDEGMASRVPYESAARTLTQSKRSFAGYMVRQGMAIVLEHNFMMTPKGRENFKNQLNQLIGSIQYTNDLDVHMALVLAPSYQKTMRERYYSLDKSPSQICREFVDLFGMMQKNVNALDILIEEGKAILRTWGGPMPDFLLCNSKLTFQMTMTPEKTNYITQGIDGVKRLRQGPDLGTYRGLSVVHSRAFAMEVGQHPRDILRRRVRTAEYYRILPNRKNVSREFEFYNEERDNWFTLSFMELLRCARYHHSEGSSDNPAAIDRVFNSLSAPANREAQKGLQHQQLGAGQLGAGMLGARMQEGPPTPAEVEFVRRARLSSEDLLVNGNEALCLLSPVFQPVDLSVSWIFLGPQFDLGIKHIPPSNNRVWTAWNNAANQIVLPENFPGQYFMQSVSISPKLADTGMRDLYHNLKNTSLNDPFRPGSMATPRTPRWFGAFSFYVDMYKRGGFPAGYLAFPAGLAGAMTDRNVFTLAGVGAAIQDSVLLTPVPKPAKIDITVQVLQPSGGIGSVNHPLHLLLIGAPGAVNLKTGNMGANLARKFLLTYEILGPLVREYTFNGRPTTGIDHMIMLAGVGEQRFTDFMQNVFNVGADLQGSLAQNTVTLYGPLKEFVSTALSSLARDNAEVEDAVYLARTGVSTWPLGLTSMSHMFHPVNLASQTPAYRAAVTGAEDNLLASYSHVNVPFLAALDGLNRDRAGADRVQHFWFGENDVEYDAGDPIPNAGNAGEVIAFWGVIRDRILSDPMFSHPDRDRLSEAANYLANVPNSYLEAVALEGHAADRIVAFDEKRLVSRISEQSLAGVTINMNRAFSEAGPGLLPKSATVLQNDLDRLEDVEIVVVRPNIEHNMLGVIMGLGGETLGNTLWGQTELSVYDDSMHGIWGMSYKYHERAIVFNEKNLIRLWDIAYDGYNGGKDDTYVDWLHPDAPNGSDRFRELTLDVSKNYRGPSMMVMAFVHDRERRDRSGASLYDQNFKRNWPSPIVFHDKYSGSGAGKETLPLDYDNLQVIDVDEFRVFNNPLYTESYGQYRNMMPPFHEMHLQRKTAGQSSADAETHPDSLAFQGSMRIKENGAVLQDIQGSGHHGPDYTGVASVRAGKGQKSAGVAPILHRLI